MPAMKNVLTLIAGFGVLDHSHVDAARAALQAVAAPVGETDWLAEAAACDILFGDVAPSTAESAVRAALEGAPIDLVAQPAAARRKKLLVADMESTIIDNEMIDEMAAVLGLQERIADITARAMRGDLDFAASLRERVSMLAGLDASVLDEMRSIISINPGAAELVATMRANGAFCALVSGGFTVFTDHVRDRLGFDLGQANQLKIAAGRLTGEVVEPILDRNAKRECLERLVKERTLDRTDTLAVGDGANDLAMVDAAGLGVAWHAKPVLAEAADMRVDHADLTALLFAQGYRKNEFVSP
jgi:phosphoserine phosphatase